MYNRYIPQNDGSFRRSRQPEQENKAPPPPPPDASAPVPPKQTLPPARQDGSVMGFLQRLLPKGFDTGDLFVVLLLLLIAGDREEEKNTALLTIALYFFM